MKTCYICKGAIKPARIEHMAHQGNLYVLIRELPAEVCSQCGETYLDDDSSKIIDDALRRSSDAEEHVEIPVFKVG